MTDVLDFEFGKKEGDFYNLGLDTRYPLCCSYLIEGRVKPYFWDFTKGDKLEDVFNFIIKRVNSEAKRGKNPDIWAFNMGYDATALLRGFYTDKRVECISFSPFIFFIHSDDDIHGARLIDAKGFFGGSLRELGTMVGLEKMEMKMQIKDVDEIKEYCINDSKIVLLAVRRLKEVCSRLGYMPKKFLSMSKLAYSCLVNYCRNDLFTKTDGRQVSKGGYWWRFKGVLTQTKFEEEVYMASRGGRFELFGEKEKVYNNIKKIDVNSLYPTVCCNNPFPDLASEKKIEQPDISILDDENIMGIIRCTVKAPDINIGYLPTIYKNWRIYPTDCIICDNWTLLEVKNAVKKYGYEIIDIEYAIIYKKLPFDMFKGFYETLFKIKENEKDKVMKLMIKRFMNYTTGRFGYRRGKKDFKEVYCTEVDKYKNYGYEVMAESKDGYVNMEKVIEDEKYSIHSNGTVYAYITAYARDFLYENLIKIPFEDLLYCACDSICFKGNHIDKFKISKDMGDWKLESEAKEGIFFGEQFYSIDGEIRASGIIRKDVCLEDLKKGIVKTSSMFSIKMGWKTGEFDKVGSFPEKTIHLKKCPKRERAYPEYMINIPKSEQYIERVKRIYLEEKKKILPSGLVESSI